MVIMSELLSDRIGNYISNSRNIDRFTKEYLIRYSMINCTIENNLGGMIESRTTVIRSTVNKKGKFTKSDEYVLNINVDASDGRRRHHIGWEFYINKMRQYTDHIDLDHEPKFVRGPLDNKCKCEHIINCIRETKSPSNIEYHVYKTICF